MTKYGQTIKISQQISQKWFKVNINVTFVNVALSIDSLSSIIPAITTFLEIPKMLYLDILPIDVILKVC